METDNQPSTSRERNAYYPSHTMLQDKRTYLDLDSSLPGPSGSQQNLFSYSSVSIYMDAPPDPPNIPSLPPPVFAYPSLPARYDPSLYQTTTTSAHPFYSQQPSTSQMSISHPNPSNDPSSFRRHSLHKTYSFPTHAYPMNKQQAYTNYVSCFPYFRILS